MEPGTKVMIEAVVLETGEHYAIIKTANNFKYAIRPSDLTVCEKAEEEPNLRNPIHDEMAADFLCSTPSFKAGQEVEWTSWNKYPSKNGHYLCYDENSPLSNKINIYRFDTYNEMWFEDSDVRHPQFWKPLPEAPRPIPAQPTVESAEDELSKIVTDYPNNDQTLSQYIDTILAWHQKHSGRVEVSVPTLNEVEQYMRDKNRMPYTVDAVRLRDDIIHFMTRKEAK